MKTAPKKKPAKAKPVVKDIVKGWACPCCPRVHAPSVTECTCRQEVMGKKINDEAENRKALREFMEAMKNRNRPQHEPFQWPYPTRPYEYPRPPDYTGPYFKPYCYEPSLFR